MRDEVDLIMKRLRIPWREMVGGQVNERKKKMVSQEEMEVRKEKGKVTREVEEVGGYLTNGSE